MSEIVQQRLVSGDLIDTAVGSLDVVNSTSQCCTFWTSRLLPVRKDTWNSTIFWTLDYCWLERMPEIPQQLFFQTWSEPLGNGCVTWSIGHCCGRKWVPWIDCKAEVKPFFSSPNWFLVSNTFMAWHLKVTLFNLIFSTPI